MNPFEENCFIVWSSWVFDAVFNPWENVDAKYVDFWCKGVNWDNIFDEALKGKAYKCVAGGIAKLTKCHGA